VLPGIFNGMIEQQLVPVQRGRREETVRDLMRMWGKDESAATLDREGKLTRAAVVNAVTRYAHEVNHDSFAQHELESAAGAMLYGAKGKPPVALPFLPME
jgi:hypothetical protein